MYRVGLLVDGVAVSHQVRDLTDWLSAQPDIELTALILHPAPEPGHGGLRNLARLALNKGLYAAASRAAFGALLKAETALFMRSPAWRERLASYLITAPEIVETAPIVSGPVYRFSIGDLTKIQALGLDLLIRCGSGILKGPILSAARDGIISMHHGDNRVNRGGPAAFWEVLLRQPRTGFIVQRLTEELDGGEVLFRGSVSTQHLYLRNRVVLYERANAYLKQTIRDVKEGRAKAHPPMLYDNRLYKAPHLADTLRYMAKAAEWYARRLWSRLRKHSPQWSVAYTLSRWENAVLWRSKEIPNPPGRFLADPFAVSHETGQYVFVEDCDNTTGKGVISAYRVGEEVERLGPVIEEPFHLSFPFIFRYQDHLYMVPESGANRDIRLYRCASFPMRWELETVLLSDVRAVDTMVFPKDGKWWLLTTINPGEFGNNDAELHQFCSDTPLGGWLACAGNPMIMDAGKGRNGGLLFSGDDVYRVAQRHGFNEYGKGASIYRIDRLGDDYAETHIQDVDPLFRPGIKGIHHLHHDGGLTVLDFVRTARG